MNRLIRSKIIRLTIFFLTVMIVTAAFNPMILKADDDHKVVKVGWHEEPYFIEDDLGRWSGYTYEYQRKIAAYTGWKFEYVHGSFSELLQMLKDGQIDMMGNISYTEERANDLLYASSPMGTESYYLLVSTDNKEIRQEDYSTLNGKKVGVAKGSIQEEIFRQWVDTHNVSPVILELTSTEDDSLMMLGNRLDAFVTVDVYGDLEETAAVWKIGSSDYFFALNKERNDLLIDLNNAMTSILEENVYFNEQLHQKYLMNKKTIFYLNNEEIEWLDKHPVIRVGYQDNYLAFCAQDKETGELTGALKDYLEYISQGFENATISFETVCYPSAKEAIEALKNNEIDCMFPVNFRDYEAEMEGIVQTPAFMASEMDAVVRAADQKEFIKQEDITVAVNEGNTNYEIFLKDNFPGWKVRYFKDTPKGLEAIANNEADCIIISNYRFSNIAKQCEKLHLTTIYTGVNLDYSIAIKEGNTILYSILTKASGLVPDSVMHSALAYYSTEDAKMTFVDFIKDNLIEALIAIIIIISLIMFLIVRDIRAEKKIIEEEKLVNVLNKQVFVDALTSVRNKGAFANYVQELQNRLDNDEKLKFAIGVFDCNDLKNINDRYGHDKGDIYLKTASRLICRIFEHSPVFRIGGDEFAVIMENDDFINRDKLVEKFKESEKEINAKAENGWEEVHVAFGIAVNDKEDDDTVNDTARRADKIMYENKKIDKEKGD